MDPSPVTEQGNANIVRTGLAPKIEENCDKDQGSFAPLNQRSERLRATQTGRNGYKYHRFMAAHANNNVSFRILCVYIYRHATARLLKSSPASLRNRCRERCVIDGLHRSWASTSPKGVIAHPKDKMQRFGCCKPWRPRRPGVNRCSSNARGSCHENDARSRAGHHFWLLSRDWADPLPASQPMLLPVRSFLAATQCSPVEPSWGSCTKTVLGSLAQAPELHPGTT